MMMGGMDGNAKTIYLQDPSDTVLSVPDSEVGVDRPPPFVGNSVSSGPYAGPLPAPCSAPLPSTPAIALAARVGLVDLCSLGE